MQSGFVPYLLFIYSFAFKKKKKTVLMTAHFGKWWLQTLVDSSPPFRFL